MRECLEVVWEGEAPFLLEVVSGFSDQIYVQLHHGGCSWTHLQKGSFSASALTTAVCPSVRLGDKYTRELRQTEAGKPRFPLFTS